MIKCKSDQNDNDASGMFLLQLDMSVLERDIKDF